MKPGSRTLGIGVSGDGDVARVAGAVVRGDRVVDGFAFGSCSVGGLDATEAVLDVYRRLDREDVRRVMTPGIAPAWFNLLDLPAMAETIERPVIAVSFEESDGLEPILQREFDGDALNKRKAVYNQLPERHCIRVDGRELFVRAVGTDLQTATEVLKSHVEDGRPEPLRVARLAARAHRQVV